MPKPVSFGSINLGMPAGAALEISDTPFRVLVLGDFSGRSKRGLPAGFAAVLIGASAFLREFFGASHPRRVISPPCSYATNQ